MWYYCEGGRGWGRRRMRRRERRRKGRGRGSMHKSQGKTRHKLSGHSQEMCEVVWCKGSHPKECMCLELMMYRIIFSTFFICIYSWVWGQTSLRRRSHLLCLWLLRKEREAIQHSSLLREILKKKENWHMSVLCQQLSAPAAWPAMHWRAMANLFLSHGDSDSELHNLSTQLTSSHWQVATMPAPCFKSPMAFVVHIWQTHALPPYLSLLNPDEPPHEGKHNTNLVQKQW